MGTTRDASWIVKQLKWKLAEIFEKNVDDLFDELDTLDIISQQEYLDFCLKDSQTEKAIELVNLILQHGETACVKFLNHLENMILRFPALNGLSQSYLEDRARNFQELVQQLSLKKHLDSKLTLGDVLSIGTDNLFIDQPQNIPDIPWHFLTKIIGLNRTARNIQCQKQSTKEESDRVSELFFSVNEEEEEDTSCSIHPLDVLCALLHCSDLFLQQEIVTKMSVCQFAVPLLLPAGDGPNSTFMLWAMRDIVKKWRPQSLANCKGFREDNVVNIEMPMFSFVRLGPNKLSKSKILNQVLNPAQQHHDFFIHDNMEGGNIERKISDGLVEMSWYFPCGKSDVFSEPIAVANLRGDLESNWEQFEFLIQISSATFVFLESMCERQLRLLSSVSPNDTKFYFIVSPGPGKDVNSETQKHLNNVIENLKVSKKQFIIKRSKSNDAEFVKNIQNSIEQFLKEHNRKTSLEKLKTQKYGLYIDVDEDLAECQKARACAVNITSVINNVEEYKKTTLNLQGDLWKKLSKIEKELCRMTNLEGKDVQQYLAELIEKRTCLHKEQNEHDLSDGIMLFINAITHLSQAERQFFLKWMKLELESISRNNVSALQAEYKDKCSNKSNNLEELKNIDQKISDSSLGVEHFLRELGQFYEAEYSMKKQGLLPENRIQFAGLPNIASDLLLDGFPLELIDGDASNIPLQWITDVLTALDKKTGGQCRIRVITVLGVQSTGKSTLLNTMFGLQFPVASGRCTRGAFMTLIKMKESFQDEIGCEFILVIDTEGLKAPELASLEGSYEHDNELATLVVGLSDITIVNMAMENTSEMRDILQMVVHAFLRMKEIGKKPNCQFVHQNVSDVSAHDKNMRDRKKLLEQLNEMTQVAARMENKIGITSFSDVMDYNLEKHNWYIPGLWQGVPPMAPVNFGYSENVYKLKQDLFAFMKTQDSPCNIQNFIKWVESLWNAVKHEKFIFSFRNSLVADAYGKLSMQFSLWEWEFQKNVNKWINITENKIKNHIAESLDKETHEKSMCDLQQLLLEGESKMLEELENYFENKTENVHLVERYREDFRVSVNFLKKELERKAIGKYDNAVSLQKGRFEVQSILSTYQQVIEEKITELLEAGRHKKHKMTNLEIEQQFETMWDKTMSTVQTGRIKKYNVNQSMLHLVKNDLSTRGSAINEKLVKIKEISTYKQWKMDKKYIDHHWWSKVWYGNELFIKYEEFANSLIELCDSYIKKKMNSDADYDDTYCQELLQMINKELRQKETKILHFSSEFELDIKLFIFGKAFRTFQEMHDRFVQKNDPRNCLEELKSQYFLTFLNIFNEKDKSQSRAKQFCEQCLKPAITQYAFSHLGERIVDDILHSSDNKIFSTRTFFQYTLLEDLLVYMSFQKYVQYLHSYKKFSKEWIKNYLSEKYNNPLSLMEFHENILSSICEKVQKVLQDETSLASTTISQFLTHFCDHLQTDLVISQKELKVIVFSNTSDVGQFSLDVQSFITDTEKQILSELRSMSLESILSRVTLKPQDELLKKVFGCGHQCPFCRVPCEAGGGDHKEHFASIHRPQGLGKCRKRRNNKLVVEICTTDVVSEAKFRNSDTNCEFHPYKEYRTYYPDWSIQPDPSIESSDYWKYIFAQFNKKLASEFNANPADLPSNWKKITKEQALLSLKKIFNIS
ncbi:up-regulator of cell proliferation-like isoform X2 [Bufo gargarizans]|uniref:up-regulator of cell proliferation-like isoform X2 n=1 Tax=Bufo gargarizans TaxID=30331 RepID=UPI001CF13117|nr:up-regulator of cell proliferation-like isoform X2 [Bufo gargarizans]